MWAKKQPFEVVYKYRNNDWKFSVFCYDNKQQPINLFNTTILFTVKKDISDTKIVFDQNTVGVSINTDIDKGEIMIDVIASLLDITPETYYWDIKLTGGGYNTTIALGQLIIEQGVTI